MATNIKTERLGDGTVVSSPEQPLDLDNMSYEDQRAAMLAVVGAARKAAL